MKLVCTFVCILALIMGLPGSEASTGNQVRQVRASIARQLDGAPFTVLKAIGISKQGQPLELFRVGRARVSPQSVRIQRSSSGGVSHWSATAMLDIIHVGLVQMKLSGTFTGNTTRGKLGIQRATMQDRGYGDLNGAMIKRTTNRAIPQDKKWHAWLRHLDNPAIRSRPPLVPLGPLDVRAPVLTDALRATQP
jgi:hypothetical protein